MTWGDVIVGALVIAGAVFQYIAHERRIGRLVRAIEQLNEPRQNDA